MCLDGLQIDSLPQMVAGVCSDDGNAQLEATTHFRKLLSIGVLLYRNHLIIGVI